MSIITPSADRGDEAGRSVQSSASQPESRLVMVSPQGDDQLRLCTSQNEGISARAPPKRPLGGPVEETVELPPSTTSSVDEDLATSLTREMGSGELAGYDRTENEMKKQLGSNQKLDEGIANLDRQSRSNQEIVSVAELSDGNEMKRR